MVKKLFKHEFMAMARMLVPMYIILIGLSVLTRTIVLFENDSVIYDIISVSSIVMLAVGIFVCFIYTVVAGIIRFYRNLFTKEGYLSFTLPVSTEAHILTKLTTSVCAYICSFAVVFIAGCIATSGELLIEIFKAAGYLLGQASNALGADFIFYVIEAIVFVVISIFTGYLLFYACICVGQLAKKSRILLALGVYFGYYYVTQALVTVMMIIFTVFDDTQFFKDIINFVDTHPYEFIHIALIAGIIFYAVLGCVYYLVAHAIMKKRLNLE